MKEAPVTHPKDFMALCLAIGFTTLLPGASFSVEDEPAKITIEHLLSSGWQVAGYTGAVDNWSAFILLRHPSETYLVQCRAGYDVTRTPRVQTNCYALK